MATSGSRTRSRPSETTWVPVLAFLQTADIYDPDRIEADRDLIRRFYLKHGYADVRVVSAVSVYDPEKKGFIVTFTIDEGARYRFGKIDIQSNVPMVDPKTLYGRLRAGAGDVYNAEAVEKSVENLSIEVARRGYPFAVVRPRGDRDLATHTISVVFTVEDGPRVYIERINVRGNTRTRDYVIRREFDVGEGDAYNRALIDRAERRLKNLNYFKTVKITNEPGSAPDRIVLNVDVEEIPTGEFSSRAATRPPAAGWPNSASPNAICSARASMARCRCNTANTRAASSCRLPSRFSWVNGSASASISMPSKRWRRITFRTTAKPSVLGTRAGFALSEELSFQARYNIYSQKITLPYAVQQLSVLA